MGLIERWVALRGPRTGWRAGFGRKGDREFYALSNVSPHCVGGMGWFGREIENFVPLACLGGD